MKKSPLTLVKERFESKDKLVEAVQRLIGEELWLDRVNSEKGLGRVSNTKLLRLHAVLTDAKQRFGSRASLISKLVELKAAAKDQGYTQRLQSYPLPRLLDLHAAASRSAERDRRAQEKAQAKPAAKSRSPRAAS